MTRILQRPMFRIGGSAGEGITSGLSPQRGLVDQPGGYAGEKYRFFESDEDRKRRMESLYPGIYDQEEKDPFAKDEKYYVKEDGSIGTIEVKKPKNVFEGSVIDLLPSKVEKKIPLLDDSDADDEVYEEFPVDKFPVDEVETGSLTDRADLLTEGDIGGLETQQEEMPSEKKDSPMTQGEMVQSFGDIKLPKSTSGADFWLNLGTSILAEPGGRPILQTIGTAAKEPLARFQQQRSAEKGLKYQHAMANRSFNLEVYKAMNDEEKLKVEREMKLYIREGMTRAEAFDAVVRRKPMSREDIDRRAKETAQADRVDRINVLKEEENIAVTKEAGRIIDFEDDLDEWGNKNFEYESDQLYIEPTDVDKLKHVEGKPDELIATKQLEHTYKVNKIYVNPITGDVYLWDGTTFTLQDINAPSISNIK
jgi:hypothetical protein